MEKLLIDGCECTCKSVSSIQQVSQPLTILEIGVVILITIMIILGLYIGWKRLSAAEKREKHAKTYDMQNEKSKQYR